MLSNLSSIDMAGFELQWYLFSAVFCSPGLYPDGTTSTSAFESSSVNCRRARRALDRLVGGMLFCCRWDNHSVLVVADVIEESIAAQEFSDDAGRAVRWTR